MKHTIQMLIMGTVLLVGGCQKDEPLAPMNNPSNGTLVSTAVDITNMEWEVVRMKGLPTNTALEDLPWIRFNDHGNIAEGNTACNEYRANYDLNGDMLRFADLLYTRRYCAEVSRIEDAYLNTLKETDSYRMAGDSLVFQDGAEDLAWLVRK